MKAPGIPETVADGVRRILAPNPSPMTGPGTNTFLLGEGRVAIIDPGPELPAHLEAILSAIRGETVSHILVTHPHRDHSPLARRLAAATGAPVLAFGPPEAGRSPAMQALAAAGIGGGEGVDTGFRPDRTLSDGDIVDGEGWRVVARHAPGHFAGHMAFDAGEVLFSGDHVLDWASTFISPPDGDVAAFMASSARLADLTGRVFLPAHGGAIEDPAGRLGWLMSHRMRRERALLDALGPVPQPLSELTRRVYADLPAEMHHAARRNLFAHLVKLVGEGRAKAVPRVSPEARYARV